MDIYNNPYDETTVAGAGMNISIEENEDYEAFCNNVTKSSTKDKEKIQNLLTNVQSKPWRFKKCFYPDRKRQY